MFFVFVVPCDCSVLNVIFWIPLAIFLLYEEWTFHYYGLMIPDSTKPITIIVVDDPVTCEKLIEQLLSKLRAYSVIGLDCEWVTDPYRHPIALLQLATTDGFCLLIRLFKFSSIPPNLIELLENNSVIKVGSAVTSDAEWLQNDYRIHVAGCLNIDRAAQVVGIPGGSLKRIAQNVLNFTMEKNKFIQCGNWERNTLSKKQISYAALDAFVPLKILEKIILIRCNKKKLYEKEAQFHFVSLWSHLIDNDGRSKTNKIKKIISNRSPAKFELGVEKAVSIKGILYENCFLQDPQGNVLCVCNNKKLEWYLERNLGTEISDSPRTVRLNFQPKNFQRNGDSLYYTVEKENKCVVCGTTELLRRKYVVPCEYRSHFPREMKDYRSHDVLLLCSACHRKSIFLDQELRKKLVMECDAPILQISLTDEARAINKLKFIAKALLKKDLLLSPARIDELKSMIQSREKCEEVTDELLHNIMSRSIPGNTELESHGEKVVKYFRNVNKLDELEIKWRRHFLESMKPQHLPKLWSVNHNPWDSPKSCLFTDNFSEM